MGADWNLVQPNGIVYLSARCVIRTDDGALISILNEGWARTNASVMADIMANRPISTDGWYAKTHPRFEAADPRYHWMNDTVFVCEMLPPPSADTVLLGAGWSADVSRTPISKTFLGEPVLMYRTEAGQPVAMSNKCPHRFAPMHQGKLKGDVVECPYHGLQFNPEGRCVLNPQGDGKIFPRLPSCQAAKLPSFPLVERDGTLWIWMGDAALADPSLIIDTRFVVERDRYAVGVGHLLVHAN